MEFQKVNFVFYFSKENGVEEWEEEEEEEEEEAEGAGEEEGDWEWEYYSNEEGWSPVDISEADKDPSKKNYFFGTVNENRVEFIVGRDLKLKNRLDLQNFFIYPIIEGTNYKKSFSYKNL